MKRRKHWLQPAGGVIDALGGLAITGRILNLNRSSVWGWTQPGPRGTGGVIPAEHIGVLVLWARENGKALPVDACVRIPAKLPAHARRVKPQECESSPPVGG